jgi:hypothetical protein
VYYDEPLTRNSHQPRVFFLLRSLAIKTSRMDRVIINLGSAETRRTRRVILLRGTNKPNKNQRILFHVLIRRTATCFPAAAAVPQNISHADDLNAAAVQPFSTWLNAWCVFVQPPLLCSFLVRTCDSRCLMALFDEVMTGLIWAGT